MGIRRGTRRVTRVPAYAFTPRSLSGLAAWYRADLGITIGTGVSAWADQSGTGDANKNLTQATGSKQPTRNASDAGYNGQPTLSFASASLQWLSSAAWAASLVAPYTIFAVGNDDGTNNEQLYCDQQQGAAAESTLYNNGAVPAHYGTLSSTQTTDSGIVVSNAKRVLLGVFNTGAGTIYVSAKTGVTGGAAAPATLTGFTAGASIANSLALNGKLAEAAVFSRALSQSEINQVLAYCGARYAIAIGP